MLKKTDPTPIGKLYIKIQKEMEAKYRDVVLMMEIGKFFEVYTYENPKTGEEIGKAKEMSRLCNILLTRKNKNLPVSMTNPYMCGFPSHSLSRFVSHLVEKGKTVVVYEQMEGKEHSTKTERGIKGIYSPAVMVGLDDEQEEEKDRSLLVVETLSVEKGILVILVHASTSTGKISFEEEWLDESEARSFLSGIVDMTEPSEILCKGIIQDVFETHPSFHLIPEWIKENKKFKEIEFQETILRNTYPSTSNYLSVIEEIGLEKHPDVLPLFCYCLQFLQDHHPLVVSRLEKPLRLSRSGSVSFHPKCLYDLNIFAKSHQNSAKSLFGLLDQTITPTGKKLLKKRMFSPTYEIEKLEKMYKETETFLQLEKEIKLKQRLTFYYIDMEHNFRRLQIGNCNVLNVYRIIKSCFELFDLMKDIQGLHLANDAMQKENEWKQMLDFISEMWDLNLLQAWKSWETNSVWKRTPSDLVAKEKEWMEKEKEIRDWVNSSFGPTHMLMRRLNFMEEEAFISVTKKMLCEMKHPEGMRQKSMSSGIRIYHKKLDEFWAERKSFLHDISQTRKKIFYQEVSSFMEQYESLLRFVLDFATQLDLIQCYAQNVKKYKLVKPILVEDQEKTLIDCKQVRHLVVEAANPSGKYVPNDVSLSNILLFGQNSAGKCFKKGTKMVKWNGEICKVEDLKEGDQLMGDDAKARNILCLTQGFGPMYEIVNESENEVLMTVNEEHILCLTDPDRSRIIEVSVKEILENRKLYKSFMYQCTGRVNNLRSRFSVSFPLSEKKTYVEMLKSGHRLRLNEEEGQATVVPKLQEIVPFFIRKTGEENEFYGFGVDGNQRFLLPDGTLVHNSTLMKSVGVSTLMAQSGMFVPCEEMKLTPIRSLFTKIGSRDDIWKGKSTFITEMTELRHMLDRSDKHSLILCDEPTSGTETFSATGIVASSLHAFLEKETMFIMTTHLHTLKQFQELMEDPRLKVKHLGMEYDPKQQKLVFDRLLRDGFGKSIYGLEIAEYLGFSKDFLKRAYDYRSRLETEKTSIVPKKRSRYNSKKWVQSCEQCGSIQNLHTHHIEPQQLASKDGYIGKFHKNRLSNLKILCRDCHEEEHHSTTT